MSSLLSGLSFLLTILTEQKKTKQNQANKYLTIRVYQVKASAFSIAQVFLEYYFYFNSLFNYVKKYGEKIIGCFYG